MFTPEELAKAKAISELMTKAASAELSTGTFGKLTGNPEFMSAAHQFPRFNAPPRPWMPRQQPLNFGQAVGSTIRGWGNRMLRFGAAATTGVNGREGAWEPFVRSGLNAFGIGDHQQINPWGTMKNLFRESDHEFKQSPRQFGDPTAIGSWAGKKHNDVLGNAPGGPLQPSPYDVR